MSILRDIMIYSILRST